MASARLLCLALALVLAVAARAETNINLTNKLVDLIRKKDYDGFVKELSKEDMDVNQPDSSGRLPLVEAVRTKDLRYPDSLLQYGALAKSKDPATGATPLHVAFQHNMVEVGRLLLAYGADPNVADKANKKARDFTPSKEIRDMIVAYDEEGPMAFEDAPNTWIKESKDSKEPYWFNAKTSESRWNTPPSCAWHRIDMQGHPIKYLNKVTGQETHVVPKSLAWVKVRQDGQELYYNYKVNISTTTPPGELNKIVLEELEQNINVRWYNEKTGEYAWSDPAYHSTWRELKDDANNRPYWFNVETGESVWEMPEEVAWVKVKDDASGQHYFFNRKSGDSVWEAPDHLAWVRHDSDL